jgi:FtsP/CotA-like multicopper oxidase with cupredoxin domain
MRVLKMRNLLALAILGLPATVLADAFVQCPGDINSDAVPDGPDADFPNAVCMHLTAGDGFITMADGEETYMFGFANVTGVPQDEAIAAGMLSHNFPAPTIVLEEGQNFFLTLTNTGMVQRPDLFDPHTVHFHGFPQASDIFDGVPDATVSVNGGTSLSYYYNVVEPGTYMYHCHVEATEHMQMGMLGNLYVRPAQNKAGYGGDPATISRLGGNTDISAVEGYVYNDGDGSTAYDVEAAIQLAGFDPEFHDASELVQPLPFANMWDRYPMLNGRGYPDTVNPAPLTPPSASGIPSQLESSLITATAGDKILLRLSNLNITVGHNLISPSIPMRVVGIDARELRTADGTTPLHYKTNSVKLAGGMSADVILDTTDVAAGTYYLYAANLNYLSNYNEDFGGMMTEIVITP